MLQYTSCAGWRKVALQFSYEINGLHSYVISAQAVADLHRDRSRARRVSIVLSVFRVASDVHLARAANQAIPAACQRRPIGVYAVQGALLLRLIASQAIEREDEEAGCPSLLRS
jgi:hypothetical protein